MKIIKKSNFGYTVMELLMVIGIFGLAVVGVTGLTVYYFNNYSFSIDEQQAVINTQSSLTQMIRELREMRTAEDGSYPISEAADNSITFYSDITNDGRTDKIRYYIDGSTLYKSVIQPTTTMPITYPTENTKTTVISENIDITGAPLFNYYNGNWPISLTGNPIPLISRIYSTRYIEVHVKISIRQGKSVQPFDLKSGVALRNLKDNL